MNLEANTQPELMEQDYIYQDHGQIYKFRLMAQITFMLIWLMEEDNT